MESLPRNLRPSLAPSPMASVIVHGGAASIAREDVSAHLAACRRAAERGLQLLARGASAVDAAVEAVVVLEDDPVTNAATGSCLNRDGVVEMDALVMVGATLELGAVVAVRDTRNPIRVARALVDEPDVNVLAHDGASRYARSIGIPAVDPASLITPANLDAFRTQTRPASACDTVGAVAVDDAGRTAAAVSTGGIPFKRPGRIGDAPLVGSGAYADDLVGAAVATGVGEGIMRVLLSKTALDFLADGKDPMAAAKAAIEVLGKRVGGEGGVILADPQGRVGFAFNTPQMSFAHGSTGDGRIVVGC